MRSATETGVPASEIVHIGETFANPPQGFTIHPKLKQLMDKRAQMVHEGGIDWPMAELLAFGTLLKEGTPIRLAGQDSRRGTFVQRHAVLIDKDTAEEWTPLLYLGEGQARFWVYDSLLSEYAAMGFEYGYSVERPDALVLWEAQFGDFGNGAQTIVDEFISSSEQKWGQRSSVVLLLPHGYEGQGPDHSSARIERYLQLCAENNMTVAYPSTAASYFHLLRRQAYARPRTPLVVFTPKSMLRSKAAASPVEAFTQGGFQPVLADHEGVTKDVTRVLLASGKVVHELDAEREKRGDTSTADHPGRAALPDPRAGDRRRRRARTPAPSSCGSRTSRATRAPGRSWRSGCTRTSAAWARPARGASWPARPRPPRPPARRRSTPTEQAELMERAFGR